LPRASFVPAPTRAGRGPCWQFVPGENTCTGQSVALVPDPAAPPPAWQSINVQCSLCVPGVPDPARGCL
jgi:hypothetical protein